MNDIYNYGLSIDVSPQCDLVVNDNDNLNFEIDDNNNINLEVKDNVIFITRETYIHHQNTPSAHWEIQHDMSRYPSVTVVDSAGTQVVGDVQYINDNVLVISFIGAFSGTAYLN